MAKSINDLRNLLRKMRVEHGLAPSQPEPVVEDLAEPVPLAPREEEPVVPAISRGPVISTPRMLREEMPSGVLERGETRSERSRKPAAFNHVRLLIMGSLVALAIGGLFANSRVATGVGVLGLFATAMLAERESSSPDMEKLSARVASLERRVAAMAVSRPTVTPEGGAQPHMAEELQELRAMVRSLYRTLENSSDAPIGERDDDVEP